MILSFLPSPQPRTVGLCATHLTASLGLLPATLILVNVTSVSTQVAAGASSSQHLSEVCLPDVRPPSSQRLQGIKNTLSFFKQMEQKPFWFILITWRSTQWPMPGSTWRGVLALEGYFIVSKEKNLFCMSPVNLRIHSFSQDSLWISLVRSLRDGMYWATSGNWKHFNRNPFS